MRAKDYIILVSGFLAVGVTAYWIIVDKSLDWSKTMTFSPALALSLVITAMTIFGTFVSIALIKVLKA